MNTVIDKKQEHPAAQRQKLLSLLSVSSLNDIQKYWQPLSITPSYQQLKAPEVGMTMVRAKTGGTGQVFNMGEMTVTRTVIRLHKSVDIDSDNHQCDIIGFGYTSGRNKKKSEIIAVIDACFQLPEYQLIIQDKLVQPLVFLQQQIQQKQDEKVEATKVNFFTMVRGE
jgi:alpha-D-ribose 1-methylphosphonate 5-triphosphate synthase subunit PhnG